MLAKPPFSDIHIEDVFRLVADVIAMNLSKNTQYAEVKAVGEQ